MKGSAYVFDGRAKDHEREQQARDDDHDVGAGDRRVLGIATHRLGRELQARVQRRLGNLGERGVEAEHDVVGGAGLGHAEAVAQVGAGHVDVAVLEVGQCAAVRGDVAAAVGAAQAAPRVARHDVQHGLLLLLRRRRGRLGAGVQDEEALGSRGIGGRQTGSLEPHPSFVRSLLNGDKVPDPRGNYSPQSPCQWRTVPRAP